MFTVVAMGIFRNYAILVRANHWVKNTIIIAPVFFSGELGSNKYFIVVVGIIIFSLMASVVYIFNDICDLEADREHEKKKNGLWPLVL